MKITKFWKSIDLNKNKLLNAKVNLPVEDEDITSKIYVDKISKYDTVKANQFPNGSPKFSWLNFSLKDKTFKELFDLLFFPIIKPIYKEATIVKLEVMAIDEYGINLFKNRLTNFRVNYVFDGGDRNGSVIPKIKVTTKTPATVTEYAGTSSENTGTFEFATDLNNIDKIELVKDFEVITAIKNDNYGTPYIPTNFTQAYTVVGDVFENIKNNYYIFSPVLYKKLDTNTEDGSNYINAIGNNDTLFLPTSVSLLPFTKDRKLFLSGNTNNSFIFGVPLPLYKDFTLNAKILESTTNQLVSSYDIDYEIVDKKVVKTLLDGITPINYLFFTLDFGYHKKSKEVNLSFEGFKQYKSNFENTIPNPSIFNNTFNQTFN